jgi:hypothetical protein
MAYLNLQRQDEHMEKQLLQEPEERKEDRPAHGKQQVSIEWAQSEWFEIYLQMARKDIAGQKQGR